VIPQKVFVTSLGYQYHYLARVSWSGTVVSMNVASKVWGKYEWEKEITSVNSWIILCAKVTIKWNTELTSTKLPLKLSRNEFVVELKLNDLLVLDERDPRLWCHPGGKRGSTTTWDTKCIDAKPKTKRLVVESRRPAHNRTIELDCCRSRWFTSVQSTD